MTGAQVAMVARRKPLLEKDAAAALNKGAGSANVISADLSTHKGLVATVEQAIGLENFDGAIDVLVLNHAIQRWGWLLPEAAAVREQRIGELGKVRGHTCEGPRNGVRVGVGL
eukprot:TRINITY_DN7081_c0_g1_i2.p3 TRINITY_DN7081_c0_g1~~TRINITY_DN7081_c0_g1_i2.p3  ORF type:complete len:113 (+),score=32.11 TRINITY_DN7081_c0_g1_i2:386-724(+)